MLNALQAIVLGIIQGATEFVPVSSSGHLVLFPWLVGWDAPGLTFNAILHLGTLLAILVYFRRDCLSLLRAWWGSMRQRRIDTPQARLAWFIILATLPAALLGFLFEDVFESLFSSPASVGVFLLITGSILALSERMGKRTIDIEAITWRDALLIGLAQAAAIAPGISRSGATIAAGLGRGLQREAAARLSFLLAIPIMAGAGTFKVLALVQSGSLQAPSALAAGFLAAAASGYLCIAFLLSYVRNQPLYPFAIYCWAVGALALVLGRLR